MDLRKIPLRGAFLLSLFFTLLPWPLHLWFFVPYLILVIYQKNLKYALWAALVSGLIIDLVGEDGTVGITSLSFMVTLLIARKLRIYFFSDRVTTLPVMTICFSSLATAIRFGASTVLQKSTPSMLTGELFIKDLLLFPGLDALLSVILFVLPAYFFNYKSLKTNE